VAQILVIEDDKVLNKAYQLILEREGHSVTAAYDGREGLKAAEKQKPAIILLDLLMPHMNGIEFLRKYDVLKKHKDVYVIILSNIGSDKEVAEGMRLGAYKYIVKAHATPKQLSVMVNHLINKNIEKKEPPAET